MVEVKDFIPLIIIALLILAIVGLVGKFDNQYFIITTVSLGILYMIYLTVTLMISKPKFFKKKESDSAKPTTFLLKQY